MIRRLFYLLGLAPSPEEEEVDDADYDQIEERRTRLLQSPAPQAKVIICQGDLCAERKEELAEALHKGQIIFLDLRHSDPSLGQSTLDFVCGVAYAMKGHVMRLSPGIFLAAPRKGLLEVWEEKGEEEESGD
ncbi:MAG TPA: cell division protein SepF [Thermosynergistes sp.]|nr:cell division protein SepF [Thermosynergistes sp.]